MASNAYLDQIMTLNGLDGFKDVIERWQRVSDNIYKFNAKKGLVIPDLLWVSDNGIDRSGILKLLTGYLEQSGNLLDFYGNVKCFEYYLEYVPEGQSFFEIQKIAEKSVTLQALEVSTVVFSLSSLTSGLVTSQKTISLTQ